MHAVVARFQAPTTERIDKGDVATAASGCGVKADIARSVWLINGQGAIDHIADGARPQPRRRQARVAAGAPLLAGNGKKNGTAVRST